MLIIGLLIEAAVIVYLGVTCYNLKQKSKEVTALNLERYEQNKEIERINDFLKQDQSRLESNIKTQNEILESLTTTAQKMREDAENQAVKAYETKQEELEVQLQEKQNAISAEYENTLKGLMGQINDAQDKLKNIEAKQFAYLQAKQRQEEINANKDYYRLAIDNVACDDIMLLRDIQKRISKKDVIDKVIYEGYYKSAYNILMSHLSSSTRKICGIYKITDQITGLAYIGQSTDIKERIKQHIKAGLAYSGATNKLYQTMQQSGLYNFTFEILEEVPRDKLNEREVYWINFYKTKDFGLNSTRGNIKE